MGVSYHIKWFIGYHTYDIHDLIEQLDIDHNQYDCKYTKYFDDVIYFIPLRLVCKTLTEDLPEEIYCTGISYDEWKKAGIPLKFLHNKCECDFCDIGSNNHFMKNDFWNNKDYYESKGMYIKNELELSKFIDTFNIDIIKDIPKEYKIKAYQIGYFSY